MFTVECSKSAVATKYCRDSDLGLSACLGLCRISYIIALARTTKLRCCGRPFGPVLVLECPVTCRGAL
jgi:hypothetical protein